MNKINRTWRNKFTGLKPFIFYIPENLVEVAKTNLYYGFEIDTNIKNMIRGTTSISNLSNGKEYRNTPFSYNLKPSSDYSYVEAPIFRNMIMEYYKDKEPTEQWIDLYDIDEGMYLSFLQKVYFELQFYLFRRGDEYVML